YSCPTSGSGVPSVLSRYTAGSRQRNSPGTTSGTSRRGGRIRYGIDSDCCCVGDFAFNFQSRDNTPILSGANITGGVNRQRCSSCATKPATVRHVHPSAEGIHDLPLISNV